MFIKLNLFKKDEEIFEPVYINMGLIRLINVHDSETILQVEENIQYKAKETPEEIMQLIKEQSK